MISKFDIINWLERLPADALVAIDVETPKLVEVEAFENGEHGRTDNELSVGHIPGDNSWNDE